MLKDPMPTGTSTSGYTEGSLIAAYRVIESGVGRSVRKADGNLEGITGDHKCAISISHSVSKENKSTLTDRSALRIEVRKDVDGAEVVAQVTIVSSLPRVGFTVAELRNVLTEAYQFLNTDAEGKRPGDSGSGTAPFAYERILNGES